MQKLFSFTVISLFISGIISIDSLSQTVEFKSIHQIELEKYKNYEFPPSKFKEVLPLRSIQKDKRLKREIFGYLPYWRLSHYDELNYDLISTIAYFGVELNSSGGITYYHSWPTYDLVDLAHQNGVKVVLVGICFNSDQIHSLVTDSSATLNAINNLLEQVELGSADGVNIDFELPRSADSSHVTAFMSALSDTFHAHNPEYSVTICVTAVNWSNRFQCRQLARATDGLFIMGYDYHWSGSTNSGAVSPLTGGTYNVANTVNYYLSETDYDTSKLILGVPYYGYDWPTAGSEPGSQTQGTGSAKIYSVAEPEANSYGKLWDNSSQTPWYRYSEGSQWHQCWYDDSTSLGLKYDLVNNKNLKGTGMWALSYDGDRSELWGAIYSHFVLPPPSTPTDFRVISMGDGNLLIAFSSSDSVTHYLLCKSIDCLVFDTLILNDTLNVISDLLPNTSYFFKVKAVNEGGESDLTELLGARTSMTPASVLVVNGYDSKKTGNTYNFIIQHGFSVSRVDRAFSSCSNECIQNDIVRLGDYEAVDWILGQEDTPEGTFNTVEQSVIIDYLRKGGALFVSGSDIGYTIRDSTFYGDYLKAKYLCD
ncbi:MAG: glycosyl hydrolase family 18 protein, partial [bacterium]|nr:glycosyl hydrolase family 18 protein [bacterium]